MNSIASVCCKEECEGTEYECACQECSKAEHDRSYSEFPNNRINDTNTHFSIK